MYRVSRAAYYKDSELDSLFNSLLIAENRRIEPWAASLLGYINHPIRSNYTIKYIYPGLEILPKIQATGDIFFPKRWCSALLGGHNSKESWEEVKKYIINNDTLLPLLKNKLLQSSYHLKNYN